MTFTNVTSFTDSGVSTVSGPLADLTSPSYQYNLYQYPSAQDPDTAGHMIVFFINIPQESFWNNSGLTNSNSPAPIANRNNAGAASNFALRPVPGGGATNSNAVNAAAIGLAQQVMQSKTVRTTSAIGLYIPPTMIFTQNMQYETISLSDALGPAADLTAFLASLGKDGNWKGTAGALANMAPDAVNAIHEFFGQNNAADLGGLRNAIVQGLGLANNPLNFLMFKQIDFRKFGFSFLLTPENPTDTTVINSIIKLFRFHSAPEVLSGTAGRFFIPPSQFDIQVMYKGGLNPNIPQINTCVCNSVSVNFAQAGKWVTYTDGQPVMIKLDLEFTEINILTKDLVQAGF